MKRVEIYTKSYCPYCQRAKDLLLIKGASFTEYDLSCDPSWKKELLRRSGQQSLPQIFVDDLPLGGCSELFELDECGELSRLLGLNPSVSE